VADRDRSRRDHRSQRRQLAETGRAMVRPPRPGATARWRRGATRWSPPRANSPTCSWRRPDPSRRTPLRERASALGDLGDHRSRKRRSGYYRSNTDVRASHSFMRRRAPQLTD
jgi:hypothetical protein